MMPKNRIKAALKAAAFHFLGSIFVAALAGALVFFLWYPSPYNDIAGGNDLFWLVVWVDIICGPLLTVVIFNPFKPKVELLRDVGFVVIIQLGALIYGLHTLWEARPLFLVMNVDRFNVISSPDLGRERFTGLDSDLVPSWFLRPITVAIRPPVDEQERQSVMAEAIQGGRDYAQRPDFYIRYDSISAVKSLQRARPLTTFLTKQPTQVAAAKSLANEKNADLEQWVYLPVVGRQDWVAVLDQKGQIQGFLKGDGF